MQLIQSSNINSQNKNISSKKVPTNDLDKNINKIENTTSNVCLKSVLTQNYPVFEKMGDAVFWKISQLNKEFNVAIKPELEKNKKNKNDHLSCILELKAELLKSIVKGVWQTMELASFLKTYHLLEKSQFPDKYQQLDYNNKNLIELREFLSKRLSNGFLFLNLIRKGEVEAIESMIKLGLNLQLTFSYGSTYLHQAAINDNTGEITELLLKQKLDPNKQIWLTLETPAHFAVRTGKSSALIKLIEGGADLSIKDRFGKRPIENDNYQNLSAAAKQILLKNSFKVASFRY